MILTCSARNESTDLLQIAEHYCKEGRKVPAKRAFLSVYLWGAMVIVISIGEY
jgi:hypothetical protein